MLINTSNVNKRIIICGPTCSGKTILRERLEQKGFSFDVSYTTRGKRPNEIDGIHYNFISKEEFQSSINNNVFYEWVKYDDNYYGTGLKEWMSKLFFIMETDGIRHITSDDRKNSFVIYIDVPQDVREQRMVKRGWNEETIKKRIATDNEKFYKFNDYDLIITNSYF
jgi:guanylate kinase